LRVLGDLPARMSAVLTPGGFEDFFPEMAKGRFHIPQEMEKTAKSVPAAGALSPARRWVRQSKTSSQQEGQS
jgi:hypothetical protein